MKDESVKHKFSFHLLYILIDHQRAQCVVQQSILQNSPIFECVAKSHMSLLTRSSELTTMRT